MIKKIILFFLVFKITFISFSQNITQTIRGTIIDKNTKTSLFGANIIIPGSNPLVGTVTDVDGKFRLEKIPVGRVNLKISYLGYNDVILSNISVNSGKELVL
ncbi:MAG: carboxypeptidase-like regulatory domain-containing protein, partial [Bacteroidales bacterium]|nr:carboxypeptidase-like regulatory domain-containing protein [Bacteroidales bacterium]